jgi:hypothetical protein
MEKPSPINALFSFEGIISYENTPFDYFSRRDRA